MLYEVITGGGVAFIRAIDSLDAVKPENEDEKTGVAIIRRALEEPLRQIVGNAGERAGQGHRHHHDEEMRWHGHDRPPGSNRMGRDATALQRLAHGVRHRRSYNFV